MVTVRADFLFTTTARRRDGHCLLRDSSRQSITKIILTTDSRIARMNGNLIQSSVSSVLSVVQIFVLQVLTVPRSVVLDANWTQLGRKRFRFCVQK